jgi:NTP pyrophosphatase (non-canonical NTP hydrolase)
MNFQEYQTKALSTAIYSNIGSNWKYPLIGLCGEVGELANKCKKIMRDDNDIVTLSRMAEIISELGDLLWYTAVLAKEFNLDLEEIAIWNINKLEIRKAENQIKGSGDNR